MDDETWPRFLAGKAPFDGEVAWVEHLSASVGRRVVAAGVEVLAARFPGATLVGSDDWHEHDGVVLPGWPSRWDDLREAVAADATFLRSSPGDYRVFRAHHDREGTFLFRYYVEEEADASERGREAAVDLAADRETLDQWVARLRDEGLPEPSRAAARPWFEERGAT